MRLLAVTVKIAFRAIWRNAMRSLLTILGVIIGVAAVIAMVSIGQGASLAVQEQIARMGNNMLIILSGTTTQGGLRMRAEGGARLRRTDATAIERDCPAVSVVTYSRRRVLQVVVGNQNWGTAVIGVTPAYQFVRDWSVTAGRFLNQHDEASGATVAVLGQTVAVNLFAPGQDPLGEIIRIRNTPFRIIGILAPKGQTMQGTDQDDTVIIPFTTAERRVFGASTIGAVEVLMVSAVSPEAIPEAVRQIRALLRERHRLRPGQADDFTIRNLADVAATAESTNQSMRILLASVASVSLLVGGIGIMNIMLVSVTERTREIGLRMAVGAKRRDILTQFLLEAIVLSTIGGFCGVLAGIACSKLVSSLAAWPTILPVETILLAVVVASAVGIFFGFYPARQAARLDPIQALRYE
jgi:putative ABC transport system permease protein